jgi:acylphosphatase
MDRPEWRGPRTERFARSGKSFAARIVAVAEDRIRRRVTVHGRVQGVFFRDSVRQQARSFGVAGWVSNRTDGAVEAVFEGDADAVGELIEFTRRGPPQAEVESLDVHDEEPEGLTTFEVL